MLYQGFLGGDKKWTIDLGGVSIQTLSQQQYIMNQISRHRLFIRLRLRLRCTFPYHFHCIYILSYAARRLQSIYRQLMLVLVLW